MLNKIKGMSTREKVLTSTAMTALILYISYTVIIAPVSAMIDESSSRVQTARETAAGTRGNNTSFRDMRNERDELKKELERKKETEKAFNRQLTVPGQTESIINLFEKSAGGIDVELTRITIKDGNDMRGNGNGSREFIRNLKSPSRTGINGLRNEEGVYSTSRIDLSFASNYENAIEYLEKIRDLPAAISFLSVTMEPETEGNRSRLSTRIEMEVFSK